MTSAVLSPFTDSTTLDLSGSLKRKQVLKIGPITYRGRKVMFDRQMMTDLAASYKARAMDSVPFSLVNDQNQHTDDPERARGQIVDLEVTDDGLDAVIKLSDDRTAALIDANPDFGVSARLVPNHNRSDGKVFPWVMKHVVGTFDPVLVGMRPWADVSLSNDDANVTLDLSNASYDDPEEPPVATIDLSKMDADKAELVRNLAAALGYDLSDSEPVTTAPDPDPAKQADTESDGGAESDDDSGGDEPDGDELGDPAGDENGRTANGDDTVDDQALAEALAELEEAANVAPVSLSADDQSRIDLANARAESAQAEVTQARLDLAAERFKGYRAVMVGKGVPPYMLDLAAPLLSQPDALVLDLSNSGGESVDATAIVRGLIEAAEDTIDLARERGTSLDPNDGDLTDEQKRKHEAATHLLTR